MYATYTVEVFYVTMYIAKHKNKVCIEKLVTCEQRMTVLKQVTHSFILLLL